MHSNARCTPQPACSKGTFYEDSDTFERRCRPCEDGTYQALPSHRSVDCVVQSVCTKGEVFVNGDNEQAGNCTACPMGTYQPSSAHRDAECLQQSNCTTGTFISTPSATSVRECFPCPERQFQANDEHQIAKCSPVEASLCSEDDRGRTRCCNSAGTLSADTGKCKCVDGYTGDDCSEVGAGCRATDSITKGLLENEMRTTISKVIPPVAIITASSIATSYVYMLRSGKPQFADAFSKLTWRAHAWACLTVGLKVFDLQTDWSFFFVSLRGEPFESRFMLDGNETLRYTETGRYNSHVSAIQFTAFGSCLLGSVLTFFDIYGMHQRLSQIITVATPITLAVMITEDMPQLAMNIIYMDTMKNREVDNMFEGIDTIAMVSFVASILNAFYSIYLILSDRCLAKKQEQKAKKEEAQARRGRAADAFVGTVDQVIAVGWETTKVVAASINQDRQIDAGAGSIRASAIATQNPVYNAGSANSANTHPYKAAPLIDATTTRLHTRIAAPPRKRKDANIQRRSLILRNDSSSNATTASSTDGDLILLDSNGTTASSADDNGDALCDAAVVADYHMATTTPVAEDGVEKKVQAEEHPSESSNAHQAVVGGSRGSSGRVNGSGGSSNADFSQFDGIGKIKLLTLCRNRGLDSKPHLKDIDGLKRLLATSMANDANQVGRTMLQSKAVVAAAAEATSATKTAELSGGFSKEMLTVPAPPPPTPDAGKAKQDRRRQTPTYVPVPEFSVRRKRSTPTNSIAEVGGSGDGDDGGDGVGGSTQFDGMGKIKLLNLCRRRGLDSKTYLKDVDPKYHVDSLKRLLALQPAGGENLMAGNEDQPKAKRWLSHEAEHPPHGGMVVNHHFAAATPVNVEEVGQSNMVLNPAFSDHLGLQRSLSDDQED